MTSPLRWRPLLEAAASSCLALALAFGCEGRGGPTDRDTSSPSAPSSPLPAARGEPQVEALWGASCAGCHGPWEGRAFTQLRRRVEADPQRIHDVLASGPEGAPGICSGTSVRAGRPGSRARSRAPRRGGRPRSMMRATCARRRSGRARRRSPRSRSWPPRAPSPSRRRARAAMTSRASAPIGRGATGAIRATSGSAARLLPSCT